MTEFLQQVFNGLALGSVYVLVAIGVTLVFGVSRLVNFAHGQFLVLGCYMTFAFMSLGLSFWVAFLPAAFAVGLAGIAVDKGLLRRTIDRPVNGFIVSLGLVIALEGLYSEIWSPDQRKLASPLDGVVEIAGVRMASERLLLLGVAIVSVVGLYYVMRRTDIGRSMRASAENPGAAALVGVSVGRMITTAFFIGALLAGIAGAFLSIMFPFDPFTGAVYIIKGLAVALIGGLGSISGALIVGLALGVIETLGSAYGIGSEWRDGYAFIAMILLLLWRPAGLFGKTRDY